MANLEFASFILKIFVQFYEFTFQFLYFSKMVNLEPVLLILKIFTPFALVKLKIAFHAVRTVFTRLHLEFDIVQKWLISNWFILKIFTPFALVKLKIVSHAVLRTVPRVSILNSDIFQNWLASSCRTRSSTNRFNYSWATMEIVATTIREYLVLFDAVRRDRKNLVLVLGSLRRYYRRRLVHLDVCAVLRMETHPFDSGISYHTEGIVRSGINFKTYRADGNLRNDGAFWDISWDLNKPVFKLFNENLEVSLVYSAVHGENLLFPRFFPLTFETTLSPSFFFLFFIRLWKSLWHLD